MAPLRLPAMIAALLIAAPASAETSPAYEEARDLVIAGKVGPALMVIGVGAMGINDQDDDGFTLLHHAAKIGSLESVIELLRAGADPAITAKDGSTAARITTSEPVRLALEEAIRKRQNQPK